MSDPTEIEKTYEKSVNLPGWTSGPFGWLARRLGGKRTTSVDAQGNEVENFEWNKTMQAGEDERGD